MSRGRIADRHRVLFVHPTMAPFIQADIDLLKRHFDVKVIDVGSMGKGVLAALKAGFAVAGGVVWCDLAFAWFADRHAKWMVRFSRLLGKPSIVVIGGYEVARVPEIGYGSLLDPDKARTVKFILENASAVLPVDESLKEEAIRNVGVGGRNIRAVHTGHDSERFKPSGQKDNQALTVGMVNKVNLKRKGLDVFLRTANLVPEVEFVLVGGSNDGTLDSIKAGAAANVRFAGSVPYEHLPAHYQRAKVYCQLSMYEGLPNALCEAMLCECVPVGTTVPGIKTAIGETGFVVPPGDPKAAAEAIRQAMRSNKGKDARARIMSEFSVEKREKEILSIIDDLLA